MDESQVRSVPAYCASIKGGSLDGSNIVVVAWQPDADDIARIVAGEPIFLSMIGSLAPHFLTTKFNDAIGL